jgi:nucleoid DNA-binding protein
MKLPKEAASVILGELAALVVSRNKKTRSFSLPGLGILVEMKMKANVGRNRATGKTIKIPPKTMVKTRVAKGAKEAIVPGRK